MIRTRSASATIGTVVLACLLTGCPAAPRLGLGSGEPRQHHLPLYAIEAFHARLKQTCEANWIGCEFQGGLTATPEFRLEIPESLWYWEVYEYTFAHPASAGHEEYSTARRARERGIKLAAVINLDDPQDSYSKPITLHIAGRSITLWVGGLDYVMPPHELRATALSVRDLLMTMDDAAWSRRKWATTKPATQPAR